MRQCQHLTDQLLIDDPLIANDNIPNTRIEIILRQHSHHPGVREGSMPCTANEARIDECDARLRRVALGTERRPEPSGPSPNH